MPEWWLGRSPAPRLHPFSSLERREQKAVDTSQAMMGEEKAHAQPGPAPWLLSFTVSLSLGLFHWQDKLEEETP